MQEANPFREDGEDPNMWSRIWVATKKEGEEKGEYYERENICLY